MIVLPVLVRPRHDGNVGAVVRVAANFGVAEIRIVDPACDLEGSDFRRMSMGAEKHVELRVMASLADAVADAEVVVATTSGRARDPRHLLAPAEVGLRLRAGGAGRIALVFGSERGGQYARLLALQQLEQTAPAPVRAVAAG